MSYEKDHENACVEEVVEPTRRDALIKLGLAGLFGLAATTLLTAGDAEAGGSKHKRKKRKKKRRKGNNGFGNGGRDGSPNGKQDRTR